MVMRVLLISSLVFCWRLLFFVVLVCCYRVYLLSIHSLAAAMLAVMFLLMMFLLPMMLIMMANLKKVTSKSAYKAKSDPDANFKLPLDQHTSECRAVVRTSVGWHQPSSESIAKRL